MGVQNLWVLLAPVGRQVEIESLAGEALAVDASIWLTQFVKAMRDDEGNMIRNAHLVGTFHRVAKLLYYGVRPVFVFDGDTPEIKKRTTARRRKRQESQAANLRQTAQRILINQIKLRREELKKNGGADAPAIDPNFLIPDASPPVNKSTSDRVDGSKDTNNARGEEEEEEEEEEEGKDEGKRAGSTALAVADVSSVLENDTASVGSEEELTLDDIDLDTSRLNKIDLHAVFSLPPHLQKDMVQKILRDRRQEVRDKFIPLAGQPEAYSHVQISSFLATVKLNRRIETARREKTQEELQAKEKDADTSSPSATGSGNIVGHGKRIASNSSKFFIYEKASDKQNASRLYTGASVGPPSHTIGESVDDSDDASNSERELLADIDDSAEAEASAAGIETYGLSLNDRFTPNKRRRQLPKGPDPGKISLSDFSRKDFARQAEQQLHQRQELQWDVDGARAAWLARHHLLAKHEPELAIEKARRARLGLAGPNDADDCGAQPPRAGNVLGTSSNLGKSKPDAVTTREAVRSLASETVDKSNVAMDSPLVGKLQPVAVISRNDRDIGGEAAEKSVLADIDADGEDDDDIEWEDVKDPAPEPGAIDSASPPVELIEATSTELGPPATKEVMDFEREDTALVRELLIQSAPRLDADRPISVDLSDSETDEERRDEMLLALKGEIEDAKAEEDLNLLKEEALQSAMVTASNLTQWAAGAVRRALEAHTQSHKKASPLRPSGQPWTPTRSRPDGETRTRALSFEEKKEKGSPAAKPGSSQAVHVDLSMDGDAEGTTTAAEKKSSLDEDGMDEEHLQKALEDSLREESSASSSTNPRYLQYATPSAPEGSEGLTATIAVAAPTGSGGASVQSLEREQRELKKLRSRQQRDVEGVSDEMVQDVMELLRLFGVPYLVCPMEAEAQCAALEMLGLVSGIITDDSDIFPFGGRKVYKNIFHHQKFVEAFFAQDIQKELGFSREDVIALAMLLGSDYTDGVRGIGIVNATEVVNAFPGLEGLREFKRWVQAFDLTEETRRAGARKKKTEAELERMTPRERFEHTHASVRRKWELGEAFPNVHVAQAYLNPQVDKSEARFSWNLPDLAGLREFCTRTFGWDQAKTDGALLPLMERAAANASAPGRGVQTRIDQFFRSYDDQVKFAKIKSKRLRSAVEGRTTVKADDGDRARAGMNTSTRSDVVVIEDDEDDGGDDAAATTSRLSTPAGGTTSRFFTNKKTSMAAVAGGRSRGKPKAVSKRKAPPKQ